MTAIDAPLPAAWLGYKVNPGKGFMVRVCSWCPPESQKAAKALAGEIPITNGICEKCFLKMQAKQLGELVEEMGLTPSGVAEAYTFIKSHVASKIEA
jgi:hypothetical protein